MQVVSSLDKVVCKFMTFFLLSLKRKNSLKIILIFEQQQKKEFEKEVEEIFRKIEKNLLQLAIDDVNEEVRLLACQFLAAFINKINKNGSFYFLLLLKEA